LKFVIKNCICKFIYIICKMEKIYILILFLSSNILLSQQNIEDKFEKTIKEIVTKESTTDKI